MAVKKKPYLFAISFDFRIEMLLHSIMTSHAIRAKERKEREGLRKVGDGKQLLLDVFFENKFLFVDVELDGLAESFLGIY